MKLFIGLMSGTSMDGIDAALVDVHTNKLIAGVTRQYSDRTLPFLQSVLTGLKSGLGVLSQLNTLIGQEFAQAVDDLLSVASISTEHIEAIGSHGQTICHDTTASIPYTVQLGCAHTIAERTGITVVADFRTRDLVVGGQGAPFAPIYHQVLFDKLDEPLAVINMGGIANVTYLEKGMSASASGYDIGPGNCLMDLWIQNNLDKPYDAAGSWASTGELIQPLLANLLADPYFNMLPPKSIGKEYFSYQWLSKHLKRDYLPQDVQATLLELTAASITQEIEQRYVTPRRVLLCGGGAHNMALLDALNKKLSGIPVENTSTIGVDPDFIEAMMFAWLANNTLNKKAIDLNHITGATTPAVLGAIYPAGIKKTKI